MAEDQEGGWARDGRRAAEVERALIEAWQRPYLVRRVYTAQAKHLLQRIIDGPPYTIKDYDTTTHKWVWPRVINHTVAASCLPDKLLLVEVWDGS